MKFENFLTIIISFVLTFNLSLAGDGSSYVSEINCSAINCLDKPQLFYLSESHQPKLTLFAIRLESRKSCDEKVGEFEKKLQEMSCMDSLRHVADLSYEFAKEAENFGDVEILYNGKYQSALFVRDMLLKQAVEFGHLEASYDLGVLYFSGAFYASNDSSNYVKIWMDQDGNYFYNADAPNLELALTCFLPLADKDPRALHNLGMIYYETGNFAEAKKYFTLAAAKGIEASQKNLKILEALDSKLNS